MKITQKTKEKVITEFWEIMDSQMSKKNHARRYWYINDHLYEIVRRYKTRRQK